MLDKKFFVNDERIEFDTDMGRRMFDKDSILSVSEISDRVFSHVIKIKTDGKRASTYRISYESFEHLIRHVEGL